MRCSHGKVFVHLLIVNLTDAETNIRDSAKQYGIGNRIVDCCSFDLTVRCPSPHFARYDMS